METKGQKKREKSFTLIELLVVIAVMGLLSSIVLVSLKEAKERARLAAAQSFIGTLHNAIGAYIIGWWPLDGNINDDSGGGSVANLNDTSGTFWTSDTPLKTGQSFNTLDAGRYIYIEKIPVNTAAEAKTTVMFWMKWINTGAGMPFCFHSSSASSFQGIGVGCGLIGFAPPGYSIFGAPFPYSNMGTWRHIAAVFYNGPIDATNNVLYIDGVRQTITAQSSSGGCHPISFPGPNVNIGGGETTEAVIGAGAYPIPGPWNGFHGLVDDVRIYNSDAGLAEVQKVYAEGLAKHVINN